MTVKVHEGITQADGVPLTETRGFLRAHSQTPRRPLDVFDAEPGAGLLWREDHERAGVQAVAEGPAGVQ